MPQMKRCNKSPENSGVEKGTNVGVLSFYLRDNDHDAFKSGGGISYRRVDSSFIGPERSPFSLSRVKDLDCFRKVITGKISSNTGFGLLT
jgi:hypothetical protein